MIGAERLHKGQRYTCTASVPFTRKDGTVSAVLTWQSDCAGCGKCSVRNVTGSRVQSC